MNETIEGDVTSTDGEMVVHQPMTTTLVAHESAPSAIARPTPAQEPHTGIACAPFSPHQCAVLTRTVDPEMVERREHDGLFYVPQVEYRRRLNEAFGIGGWALKKIAVTMQDGGKTRKGDPQTIVFYEAILYAEGRFVAEAIGEARYPHANPQDSYATATEKAKSDALTRCCKDLGMFTELWDPKFLRALDGRKAKWQAPTAPTPAPSAPLAPAAPKPDGPMLRDQLARMTSLAATRALTDEDKERIAGMARGPEHRGMKGATHAQAEKWIGIVERWGHEQDPPEDDIDDTNLVGGQPVPNDGSATATKD